MRHLILVSLLLVGCGGGPTNQSPTSQASQPTPLTDQQCQDLIKHLILADEFWMSPFPKFNAGPECDAKIKERQDLGH